MESLFIECVKKRPCLWKTDIEEYKMNEMKDEAWRSVIVESGIETVKEAKYLWKKLRDIHRQAVSRKRKDKHSKKWKYEDHMAFLLPYFQLRKCPESDYTGLDETENEHDDESGSTTPKQPRKTENVFVDVYNNEERNLGRINSVTGRESEFVVKRIMDPSRPALESFFTSMCEMTNTLPEHIQLRVERKIFDIVMEAREEHLQNQMTYFGT